MTLNALEHFDVKIRFRPQLCCSIDASFGAHCTNLNIDPYYQRQKCRPMTLVSENIRFMRIFARIPLGWGVKRHWGLSTTAIFGDLGGEKTSEIRQAILYDDMLPLVDRQMIAKWMTLSGYFMTKCIFGQHFLNQSVWVTKIVQPLQFCGVLCMHDHSIS